jgi:hypothetical protein
MLSNTKINAFLNIRVSLFLCFKNIFKKNIKFFFSLIFFMFSNYFDVLILKIKFLKINKYYFNIFP